VGVRVVVKVSCGIRKKLVRTLETPFFAIPLLYEIGDRDIKTLPTMFSCSFSVCS